jgi:hypothetical protein
MSFDFLLVVHSIFVPYFGNNLILSKYRTEKKKKLDWDVVINAHSLNTRRLSIKNKNDVVQLKMDIAQHNVVVHRNERKSYHVRRHFAELHPTDVWSLIFDCMDLLYFTTPSNNSFWMVTNQMTES